ncbi:MULTISPECIES: ABC transporter substrate-binding protein [unclassified Brevundimonas]|uniref:ABC transporter substrate-binding protein n=1 Tax=unclassified Brevundimonas TaxID=2622653 RepID=UPI001FD81F6C|nr:MULTISPECIES: ABC transporter substrate-binding protein [unclassified Brevundimonas]
MIRCVLAIAATLAGAPTAVQAEPLRVMALDQCADQYVLALRPDAALILSPRADDPDSQMRAMTSGHRLARPTLETAVLAEPDVVVRYWGGDARMLAALERSSVRTVTIQDASDFAGIRRNLRDVGRALEAEERAEVLIARMDARLTGAARAQERSAVYLTAGGFTAGPGTLIDAMMRGARLINQVERAGFSPISVERLALAPPAAFVLGFFDQARADWRGAGRHPVARRLAERRVVARLPAALLTCPAWFAAEATAMMAEGPSR